MRTSVRSLARLVGRDNATSRCRTIATATVARPAIVQRGCVATVAAQAVDLKGKAKQETQEQGHAVLQSKRGASSTAAWRRFGLQQQSSSWAQRGGTTVETSARFYHIHTLHTSATTHNAPRAPGIGTPSSSSSSTLPPPPPTASSNTPASLAGLGTTQLSPDIMLRCTIFDSTGSATSTSGVFKKSRLCSDHGLEPRDLRKIDSRVPNLVPTILARRGGILVNILHIRAMIKRDKVLLFDSYGSTDSQLHSAFVYNLQHNLRPLHHQPQHHGSGSSSSSSVAGSGGLAYEFRALESILVSVLDALRIELGVVRGWTSGVLEQLDDDVDREKLRTLLQVSRKLNAFLSRSKAVKNAVVEVLENEEDMQLMYLSTAPPSNNTNNSSSSSATSTTSASNASSSANSDNAAETNESQAMDELELLLESFDKQVEEVVAETTQLHSDITNTQEVVELILDNNRNKLLALDLKTSIATMGISAGTLWAGLFGMNLKSHMEELDWAFAVVSGVAFGAVVLTAGVGLRRLERLRKVGLGMRGKIEDRNKGGWLERLGAKRRKKLEGSAGGAMLNVGGVHAPGGYQPAFAGVYGGYPMHPHFAPGSAGNGFGAQPFSPHGEPQQQQHASSWLPHGVHPFPPEPIADTPSNTISSRPSVSATATAKGSQQAAEEVAEASAASAAGGSLGMGLGSKWDSAGGSGAGKKRRGKT